MVLGMYDECGRVPGSGYHRGGTGERVPERGTGIAATGSFTSGASYSYAASLKQPLGMGGSLWWTQRPQNTRQRVTQQARRGEPGVRLSCGQLEGFMRVLRPASHTRHGNTRNQMSTTADAVTFAFLLSLAWCDFSVTLLMV